MDYINFLNILENTLNNIEVRGKDNVNRMLGCLNAIEYMRNSIQTSMQKTEEDGGDKDGRQSDIGTGTSIDDNTK